MKEPAVEFSIAPISCGPICNRLVCEEAGPHRTYSVHDSLKTSFRRRAGQSIAESR
jgi:hypothetical protein